MILFISDLHLCAERPETTQAFLRFLQGPARQAQALWILGDLFEYWAGDDDLRIPFNRQIADELSELTDSGVKTYLIVGNRDFLLGRLFSAYTGIEIVQEPYILPLGQHNAILMHGDTLCTDDVKYMNFRRKIRSRFWQTLFLSLPVFLRHKIAGSLRANSEISKKNKNIQIMDVNTQAVVDTFHSNKKSNFLIHGHTHRPACHALTIDNHSRTRWVLADWHDKACWLEWNGEQLRTRSE